MWDALRVVGPIKGYGGLQPLEEGRHGWLDRIDLAACDLLAALGVVGSRPSEDDEAATVLPLGVVRGWVGVLPVLPFVGASR